MHRNCDITKCSFGCLMKKQCLRWTTPKKPYQHYKAYKPNGDGECMGFLHAIRSKECHGNAHKYWHLQFKTTEEERDCYDNLITTLDKLTKPKGGNNAK